MEAQNLGPELVQPRPNTPLPGASDLAPLNAEEIDANFGAGSQYIDLVSSALGSTLLANSDEFFAAASNLIEPKPPIHRPGVFVPTGAWYDGWETRRHNSAPFDYVIIRLGVAAGLVRGVEVDTAFFTGNYAPEISVEGTYEPGPDGDVKVQAWEYAGWKEVLGVRECGPSSRHGWVIRGPIEKLPITHVRLRMYPDGGIARFRLYGLAKPVWPEGSAEVELSAARMGGTCVRISDQHFGTGANLLLPGRGKDMGDGWETKRSRGEHVDWAIIKIGARGTVSKVVVDTAFFRGNFPKAIKVEALDAGFVPDPTDVPGPDDKRWTSLLPQQAMRADEEFHFRDELAPELLGKPFTHFKLTMIPDGGIKRFRVFGRRV